MDFDFKTINSQIQNFLTQQTEDLYALDDKNYKLPLSDAVFCAMDTVRNKRFFDAIGKAVANLKKENMHLVYAGSGTGILGIFALACGVRSALFLEHNPYSLQLSKKVVQEFNFSSRVEFLECDATEVELHKKYDLLISETLTSGFVNEDFPRIISHLKQFGNTNSIIIPEKFEVELQEENDSSSFQKQYSKGLLDTHHFSFVSQDGFSMQTVQLHNGETTKIRWKTTATLFGDVQVSSGETMSFLNEMTREVKGLQHQLFDIMPAEQ